MKRIQRDRKQETDGKERGLTREDRRRTMRQQRAEIEKRTRSEKGHDQSHAFAQSPRMNEKADVNVNVSFSDEPTDQHGLSR